MLHLVLIITEFMIGTNGSLSFNIFFIIVNCILCAVMFVWLHVVVGVSHEAYSAWIVWNASGPENNSHKHALSKFCFLDHIFLPLFSSHFI